MQVIPTTLTIRPACVMALDQIHPTDTRDARVTALTFHMDSSVQWVCEGQVGHRPVERHKAVSPSEATQGGSDYLVCSACAFDLAGSSDFLCKRAPIR